MTEVPKETSDVNNLYYSGGSKYFVNELVTDNSKFIIICVPGLGGHAGNYKLLQEDFAKRGLSTVAIDLRGFGHCTVRKGYVKNIGLHINDIDQIVDLYRKKLPGRKILLLGESLGTSLCLWYSSIYPEKTDGLILTSLVTKKGMEEVRFKTVFNLVLGYTFSPGRPVFLDFDPSVYTDDPDLKKWLRESDTLGSRKISAKYLLQSGKVIKQSYNYLCLSEKPVFVLQGGKDFLSDKAAIENIIGNCKSEKIRYEYFPEGCHSIVNSLDRQDVFNSIAEWIRKFR